MQDGYRQQCSLMDSFLILKDTIPDTWVCMPATKTLEHLCFYQEFNVPENYVEDSSKTTNQGVFFLLSERNNLCVPVYNMRFETYVLRQILKFGIFFFLNLRHFTSIENINSGNKPLITPISHKHCLVFNQTCSFDKDLIKNIPSEMCII